MRFLVVLGLLLGALPACGPLPVAEPWSVVSRRSLGLAPQPAWSVVSRRSPGLAPQPALSMVSRQSPALAARPAARRADLVAGLAVLRDWDARRARAWSRADAALLGSLYVPGSSAGRADVRLLRAYRGRGLVVRRLVTQVFAARTLERRPHVIRLRVFDRVAGGLVVRDGRAVSLGSSRPVVREVVFRRAGGRWKVVDVSGSARAPGAVSR